MKNIKYLLFAVTFVSVALLVSTESYGAMGGGWKKFFENITTVKKPSIEVIKKTVEGTPYVVSTDPGKNATNVDVKVQVTITFNKDMDEKTINKYTVLLNDMSDPNNPKYVEPEKDGVTYSNKTAKIITNVSFKFNTKYAIYVKKGVKSSAGFAMGSDYISYFTTTASQLVEAPIPEPPAVAVGYNHTLLLKKDGTVWAWGYNEYGQLGNGKTEDSIKPVKVINLEDVIAIDARLDSSMALKKDGTVYVWGSVLCVDKGSGGPVKVEGLNDIIAISLGSSNLALDKAGHVWKWGYGNCTPTEVKQDDANPLVDLIAISAKGNFYVALKNDGIIWAWAGNLLFKVKPILIGASAISAYYNSNYIVVLKNDGKVYDFDVNYESQDPDDMLKGVKAISVGYYYGIALNDDGTVSAWGENIKGQLGNGTTYNADVDKPVKVVGKGGSGYLKDVIAVAAGYSHTVVLKSDGTVWAWGWNKGNQLGFESTNPNVPAELTPNEVPGIKWSE